MLFILRQTAFFANLQDSYCIPPQVNMPRFINIVSLVSLISLGSIVRGRPVTGDDAPGSFSFTSGPFLNPPGTFSPAPAIPEIPQDLDFPVGSEAKLDAPLGTTSDYYLESMGFDIAGGGTCRVSSLKPTCCSPSRFTASSCNWGSACLDTDVLLCCGQSADGTPSGCEPPRVSPVQAVVNSYDDDNYEYNPETGLYVPKMLRPNDFIDDTPEMSPAEAGSEDIFLQ